MEQQPEVEILVHIGAPSRAVDDTRYRSLATSYLEFQPARRVELSSQASPSLGGNNRGYEAERQGILQDPSRDIVTGQPSSEPLGTLKSPQASFQSVLDNAASPRILKGFSPEDESASAVEESTMPFTQSPGWQSPSSIVQDSFMENHIDVSNFTSPTRVLEHYLQRFDSPSTGPTASQMSVSSASRGGTSRNPAHTESVERCSAPLVPYTPSIVPCTPPGDHFPRLRALSKRTCVKEQHKDPVQQQPSQSQDEVPSDSIIEETIMESSSDPRSVTRADSEPAPTKRHKPNSILGLRPLPRAASDIGPRPSSRQKSSVLTVSFLSDHGYTYESLELRAPDPSISMTDVKPENFITPGLERLAQDLSIPKRYRPKEVKRNLLPLERGYWLVDCSTWDSQLKRDAWAYLANYVGTGVAGWGIWCRRDIDFRSLRVYCWGLVAAHVYLLLYLASQRKILYTGGSWIDSEGIPVVVMDTRD